MSAKTLLPYFTGAMRWYPVEGYVLESARRLSGEAKWERTGEEALDSDFSFLVRCGLPLPVAWSGFML